MSLAQNVILLATEALVTAIADVLALQSILFRKVVLLTVLRAGKLGECLMLRGEKLGDCVRLLHVDYGNFSFLSVFIFL